MDDRTIANIARFLAKALMDRAHSRSDDDVKTVARLQTELCAAVRQEMSEAGHD